MTDAIIPIFIAVAALVAFVYMWIASRPPQE